MEIFAVKTPIIKPGDDLVDILITSMEKAGKSFQSRDIIVVAETVLATIQDRIINLDEVKVPSLRARELATKYSLDPKVVDIIIKESQEILGGVDHVLLTRANGLLLANAGVDASNAGEGNKICLLPENPWDSIQDFRTRLEEKSEISPMGAILADSRVQPLKVGVIGGALAVSGFQPVEDRRGMQDLFGRSLIITQIAVADDLTSAAELLMGEAAEQTPFVVIRNAPVQFVSDDDEIDRTAMIMPENQCLFMNVFKDYNNSKLGE